MKPAGATRKQTIVLVAASTIIAIAFAVYLSPIRWTHGGLRLRGRPGPSTIKPRPEPLTDAEKALAGSWSWHGGMAGSELVLAGDGTFKASHGACLGSSEWQGTWKLEEKRLHLIHQSSKSWDSGERDSADWEADDDRDEYCVVTWGERVLLVEWSDLDRFVQDVNTNCERGQGGGMRYSRGQALVLPTGQPDLPDPWKARLLAGEIRGRVLEVQSSGRIRADLGTKDGVREGMLMFVGGGTKAYPVNLRVVAAQETECTLEITANDQKLKVDVGAPISSHAYKFDGTGKMIDRSSGPETEVQPAGLEISLNYHSGDPGEGRQFVIKGDGTVVRRWTDEYSLLESEAIVTDTLRIPMPRATVEELSNRFQTKDVQALAQQPRLPIEAKDHWPKQMRYLLTQAKGGVVSFEGEVAWFDPHQAGLTPSQELVEAIEGAVRAQIDVVQKADAEFLTTAKVTELIAENADLLLTMDDIQGLWGGDRIRLGLDGGALVTRVRPPAANEKGQQVSRHKGTVDAARARSLITECMDNGAFDFKRSREIGVPDEVIVTITLRATIGGVTYSRQIWLWAGEVRSTQGFSKSYEALRSMAHEIAGEK